MSPGSQLGTVQSEVAPPELITPLRSVGELELVPPRPLPARTVVLARPRLRDRQGEIGLGALVATVAVLAVSAPETNSLLPESVRPVPAWLAGVFGGISFHLSTVPLVVVLGAMLLGYVVTVRQAERLSLKLVIGTILVLHVLVLLAPPLFSTDVFSYQAYARMFSLYGANPYQHGPYAFPLDAVYPFIGAKWVYIPTAYGPLFTALSAPLAHLSIATVVIAYKSIAALSSLAILALVWRMAPLRGVEPRRAVALVGLNPLLVVYGVGGGHNDLLMLTAMVGAIALMLAGREVSSGGAMATAASIKLTAALVAPFALAEAWGSSNRRRRRDLVLGVAVATVAVAGLTLALFGTGSLQLVGTLRLSQTLGDWHSIPGFIATRLGFRSLGHITGFVLGAVFLVVAASLLRRVWRRELDWIDGAAWTTLAMLVSASSLLPWYVAWLLPLAALAHDRRLLRAAIIITAVVMFITCLGYVPNGRSVLNL